MSRFGRLAIPGPLRDRARQELSGAKARFRGHADVEALRRAGACIGERVYLAPSVLIDPLGPSLVSIGDDSTLAPDVHILIHDASMRTHLGHTWMAPVRVGSRTFLGARVLVLPGITIGDDVIVAAASVVSADRPDGSLAVGSPAKVVGTTEDYIARRKARAAGAPTYDKPVGDCTATELRHLRDSGGGWVR